MIDPICKWMIIKSIGWHNHDSYIHFQVNVLLLSSLHNGCIITLIHLPVLNTFHALKVYIAFSATEEEIIVPIESVNL